MGRGEYRRAISPEQHPIVAWGEDRAVDHAKARAAGAIATPVAVAGAVGRTGTGFRRAWIGTRALADRETPVDVVGRQWFHSVRDRMRALQQLDDGFLAIGTDIGRWVADDPSSRAAHATAQWIADDVILTFKRWQAFTRDERDSWLVRAGTEWKAFETWREKLVRIRELARAHGIVVTTPEPPLLEQTIWEQGQKGTGGKLGAALGVAKVGIAIGTTIVGMFGAYFALSEIKSFLKAATAKKGGKGGA